MNNKYGDYYVYTNEDGSKETLIAEATPGSSCVGCVGAYVGADGTEVCTSRICDRLPQCAGIIWKEAVS